MNPHNFRQEYRWLMPRPVALVMQEMYNSPRPSWPLPVLVAVRNP